MVKLAPGALLLLSSTISTAVAAPFLHQDVQRVRRGGHIRRAPVRRHSSNEQLEKRDWQSFVNSQVDNLKADLLQHGGGTQDKIVTYVDENGKPENIDIKESFTSSPSGMGGDEKHWSWSWSSGSSSPSAPSSPGSNEPNSIPSFSTGNNDNSPPNGASGSGSAYGNPGSDPDSEDGTSSDSHPNKSNWAPKHAVTTHTHHTSYEYNTHTHTHGNQTETTTNYQFSSKDSWTTVIQDYVVTSNVPKSSNPAPFAAAQIEWLKEHDQPQGRIPNGQPIPRPADAGLCNKRFPFTGQTYNADAKDDRFIDPVHPDSLDEMSKKALDLQNQERARYGLQPLQWNNELANMAACWADLKAYGHSEDHFCPTGENIAMGYGAPCYQDPTTGMENAINSFLDEDRIYASNPTFGESTGHWTQIVWKETKYVGCATTQRKNFMSMGDGDTSIYVVCEYYPPGNVMGQFDQNVPHPSPPPSLRTQCSANEQHGS